MADPVGGQDEGPEISTIRYSSVEEDTPYQPLNLAGLTRFSRRFQSHSRDLHARLKEWGAWLWERWEGLYDRFLLDPPAESAPEEPEAPAPFRFELPTQERMGRLSLHERRKARVRRQLQALTVCGLILVLGLGFGMASLVRLPHLQTKAVPSPKASAQPLLHYTVRPNDCWSRIAQRYGIPLETLCQANGKSPNDILRPGLVLKVPGVRLIVHVVKPGETVSELLHRYGVSLTEFKKANPLEDPRTLRVGQKLYFKPH